MFRGTTARALLALLAAALLALPFFAPGTSFASAHTVRHVEATAKTGKASTATALRDELATLRDCGPAGTPTGPLRTRDRHGSVDSGPGAPDRPTAKEDPTAARAPAAPGAVYSRTARSSAGHTPAALQVFRC